MNRCVTRSVAGFFALTLVHSIRSAAATCACAVGPPPLLRPISSKVPPPPRPKSPWPPPQPPQPPHPPASPPFPPRPPVLPPPPPRPPPPTPPPNPPPPSPAPLTPPPPYPPSIDITNNNGISYTCFTSSNCNGLCTGRCSSIANGTFFQECQNQGTNQYFCGVISVTGRRYLLRQPPTCSANCSHFSQSQCGNVSAAAACAWTPDPAAPGPSAPNVPLIVGLSVGVGVPVLGLAALGAVLLARRRTKKPRPTKVHASKTGIRI
jgi:hypothetical protein